MARRLPREVAELTLDLGLHVERLLAAGDPPRVARLHEGPDLLHDLGILRRRRPRELLQLLLDVERGLAAGQPAGVAGLAHLTDLVLALCPADRRGSGRVRPQVAVLADRQSAPADV